MRSSIKISVSCALLVVIVVAPVAAQRGGLVAWWSMDEPYGVRADSHGDFALTDNNTVLSTAGLKGNAAMFIEDNDEYLSYHGDLVDDDFTIAMWINRQTNTPCALIDYGWQINDTGCVINANHAVSHTASLYGWHFVAVAYSSGVSTLRLDSSSLTTTLTMTHGSDIEIGRSCSVWIDEVGVWNRRLSDSELDSLATGMTYGDLTTPDTERVYLPYIAKNAQPGLWTPPSNIDDDDIIIVDFEDDTTWWDWATGISDNATPLFSFVNSAQNELGILNGDICGMELDPQRIDEYDDTTIQGDGVSIISMAYTMGHAIGQPFGWLSTSRRYIDELGAWYISTLVAWIMGAVQWIAFVYAISFSIRAIVFVADIALELYHMIPGA